MATIPSLNTFKLAGDAKPCIGFRVIVSGGDERYRNNPRSRHPEAYAGTLQLQNHLIWMKEEPSPFVSLWTSWTRAVNWAKSRARSGGQDIDIVAVWIHEQDVYDAYKAATVLLLPPEKLREYYDNEVVIVDRGRDADFSVLAGWKWVTERRWEMVTFDVPRLALPGTESLSTTLPIGLLEFEPRNHVQILEGVEAVRWRIRGWTTLTHEVCTRAGPGNDYKAVMLAWLLCEANFIRCVPRRPSISSARMIAAWAELEPLMRALRALRPEIN